MRLMARMKEEIPAFTKRGHVHETHTGQGDEGGQLEFHSDEGMEYVIVSVTPSIYLQFNLQTPSS